MDVAKKKQLEQQIVQGLQSRYEKDQIKAIRTLKKMLNKKLQGIIGKRGNYYSKKDWRQTLETLFQEVVVKLFDELLLGKTIDHLEGWCLVVARNLMISWRKGEHTWKEKYTDINENIPEEEVDDRILEEKYQLLEDAWEQLGENSKQLLYEGYWQGKQWKDIAQERGQEANAIRQAVYKCIKKLRKLYQKAEAQKPD